ncbi:hypothetical protein CDL12_10658 [Handroanthus impetiginosus]|uniref:Uncharacterized protein n=1 Tax=Handroanthus impetiginosus TaxID=429701 RepID=A0A2G9HGY2_9LAMI|nr:hypothetical protein CDL12_10658 [Handroanthus impetiginosus]
MQLILLPEDNTNFLRASNLADRAYRLPITDNQSQHKNFPARPLTANFQKIEINEEKKRKTCFSQIIKEPDKIAFHLNKPSIFIAHISASSNPIYRSHVLAKATHKQAPSSYVNQKDHYYRTEENKYKHIYITVTSLQLQSP